MKYRVLEIKGLFFYPQYFDYEYEKWCKFTAFEKDGCGFYTDNEYNIAFDSIKNCFGTEGKVNKVNFDKFNTYSPEIQKQIIIKIVNILREEKPKYWVVWPHSKSKGWCDRLTGNL